MIVISDDRPDRCALAHDGARVQCREAQRGVEVRTVDQGEQAPWRASGERVPASVGKGHRVDVLADRYCYVRVDPVERRTDQAATTGLVSRMLSALQHDRAGTGRGGGTCGGQTRRTGADYRDVPSRCLRHPRSVVRGG